MAIYFYLFIFLLSFEKAEFSNGLRKDKYRRSLHIARHLRDELSSPRTLTINLDNDLNVKTFPAYLKDIAFGKTRKKRHIDDEHKPNSTVVSIYVCLYQNTYIFKQILFIYFSVNF